MDRNRNRTRTRSRSGSGTRMTARLLSVAASSSLVLSACAAEQTGPLVLLTHDSFEVSTEVMAEFTDRTGIEVSIVPIGDTGSALNRVILTADDPEGDLLFGVDSTFLTRALDADLFLPYEAADLATVDPALRGDPRVTPVTFGDVCVNYDVAWFAERGLAVPTDLRELADPAYAGLLAVQNPATSSPGLAFLLGTIEALGVEGAFELWADLRTNDVLVTDGWTSAYYGAFTAASEGDRPLVVSYASSPPAEVFFAADPAAPAPTGVIAATCFRQVEYVGILRTTERVADAQALVDFLLSRTFQEDVPLTMFVFPVRGDAVLPDVFVEHAVVPSEPLSMDPARIDAERDAWIERFTVTVLR
jgi:thiamine transport system substrate-binding protein